MFSINQFIKISVLLTIIITFTSCIVEESSIDTTAVTPTSIVKKQVEPIEVPAPSPTPSTITSMPDIPGVVDKVIASVVSVFAITERRDIFGRLSEGESRGSGVIFKEDGHILTNNHVVDGAKKVEVVMTDGRRLDVEVVGTDPSTDLAVLKLDNSNVPNIIATKLGDTEAMRIGEWVIAIGNPLGLDGSVTVGIVSAKGRTLRLSRSVTLYDLVQTDTVINPGNSGGPLINLRGEVVGINTAIIRGQLSSGQSADGIGFAVSMNTAIPVSEQLIKNGKIIWPWLGVNVATLTPVLSAEENLHVDIGVLVVSLVPDGPAFKAGLQDRDVIVSLDGKAIKTIVDLQTTLRQSYKVGDNPLVTVFRGDEQLGFNVFLEEMPR